MSKTFIQIQDGDGEVREVEIDEEVRNDMSVLPVALVVTPLQVIKMEENYPPPKNKNACLKRR